MQDDRVLHALRHVAVRHEGIGLHRLERRLVADPAEVLQPVLRVEREVEEQVREHRVLRGGRDRHQIVVDHAAALFGEPVAEVLGCDAVARVVLGADHVTRPCLVYVEHPLRELRVRTVDREPRVDGVDHLDQVVLRDIDVGRVLGIDVLDAVLQQRHRDRLAVVVVETHLPRVALVPEDLVGVLHREQLVGVDGRAQEPDPRRVDRVGNGVTRLLVVEGALDVVPEVVEVPDVVPVQGLQELAGHETPELVDRREEHVGIDVTGAEALDRGLHVVEGRVLDLDAVLLAELLELLLPVVVVPVEHLEDRVGLGLEVRRDRLVVVVDRHRHRVVGARCEVEADAGVRRGPAVVPALAGGEDRRGAGERDAGSRGAAQELAAADGARSIPWVTQHRPSLRCGAASPGTAPER